MARCAHYAFCKTPGGGMERIGFDTQGKATHRTPVKADKPKPAASRKSALTGKGGR